MQSLDRRRTGPDIIRPQHARELGLSKLSARLVTSKPYLTVNFSDKERKEINIQTNPEARFAFGTANASGRSAQIIVAAFILYLYPAYTYQLYTEDKYSSQ
jgi:hypothetical protein